MKILNSADFFYPDTNRIQTLDTALAPTIPFAFSIPKERLKSKFRRHS
jgi:hypothetical protein